MRLQPRIRFHVQSSLLTLLAGGVACNGTLEIIERAPDPGRGDESSGSSSSSITGGPADEVSSAGSQGCDERDWYEDLDGDGFGRAGATAVFGCEAPFQHVDNDDDCDDSSPAIHPDAVEHCDQVDNDCDEAVDEWSSANTACGECLYQSFAERIYYRCEVQVGWLDAADYCQGRGAELAGELSAELARFLAGLGGADAHWIGLSDRAQEGRFVAADGTAPSFDGWAADQPDGEPGDADCVVLRQDGLWYDEACDSLHSAFCVYSP